MLITGPTFSGFLRGRVEIASMNDEKGRIVIAVDGAYHWLWIPSQRLDVSKMHMPLRFRPRITVERREI